VTSYFPKRGEEQVAGWNKDGAAPTMVEWTASGQDVEVRVDQETCCRVLDISDGAEGERRIGAWADGEREGSIRAQLISSTVHIAGGTKERDVSEMRVMSAAPGVVEKGNIREELEGIGRGCTRKYHREAYDVANDGKTTLYGFSDGSLSGDRNYGGYSWLLAIKEAGTGAGRVIMSGGGAAAAEDKENTLLNTTRMEALGLAAGMSFARDWKGPVEWHLDNEGARRNYRKMRHWTAYDWCKGGDRDVFGYMEQLRGRLLGNWKVLHVDGHVEKRKKDRKTWTFEEIGNDKSDLIAGRCMRAAAQDGRDDAAALVKWNAQVDAAAWHQQGKVSKPTRNLRMPLVRASSLPTLVKWQVRWDGEAVVGPVSAWLGETIRNVYSNEYLADQSAALFVQPGGDGVEAYTPEFDTRLIRNVWMRGGNVKSRVTAAKYMWALCACNKLFHERFARHPTGECSMCTGETESVWHVLGECADADAVAARKQWAERMQEVLRKVGKGLDPQVARALLRMWGWTEGSGDSACLPAWEVGQAGPEGFMQGLGGVDAEIKELLIGVAKAGSWAAWNGVFEASWIKLLCKAGLSYRRARKLTGKLAAVIRDERVKVSRVRHDREAATGKHKREERSKEVDAEITRLIRENGSNVAAEFLLGSSLRHREKWLRSRKAQAARRKVRATRIMMQRDTKHKAEWDAVGWVGPRMEQKQRTFKRGRHGVTMTGGSGDGAGAEVCWAKGKVSSASAGTVRAQARDRRRLGETGGLNAVVTAPRVVYSSDEDEISEFRARSAASAAQAAVAAAGTARRLAQNAIGLTKGYAAVRLEYPTFSSERAARLKTTQARKVRERKRRQVADKELSASVVLVCACDGGCRISEDERWGRCLCRVCDGKDTKFTGKKCAEGQATVAWIGAVRASRRVWMKQRGELASESDEESDQDDTDEGMRSDTEADTKQEAGGTGDTKAKVGKGRKRKREAGAMEGDGLRRHVAPGGDGRTTPFGGAAPPLRGGAGGGGGGGGGGGEELAAGGVQAKADHAVT